MKSKLIAGPSEFSGLADIEYFNFEEDFVEENVRCIPMIVRFKMDKAGIKLKLAEWSKFTVEERTDLAKKNCGNDAEVREYNKYLTRLVEKHTGKTAASLEIDIAPGWANIASVPEMLNKKLNQFGWSVSAEQWNTLTNLQRFALLKLCKGGHEHKNLPKAMKEFKLLS